MISAAKLAANRANAQKSTGPRTAAGKLRAAQNVRKSTGPITPAGKKRAGQNARRHGLTLPASRDPSLVEAIARLAHAIAGASHNPQAIELATRLATAEVDLLRARRTRLDLLDGQPFDNIRRLAAIEYYERRARTRRKLAVRAFNAIARSLSARPQPAQQELRKRTEANPPPTPRASSALR